MAFLPCINQQSFIFFIAVNYFHILGNDHCITENVVVPSMMIVSKDEYKIIFHAVLQDSNIGPGI